ncbi:hypothetical protein WDU94_012273 [Cyamophila willieti]
MIDLDIRGAVKLISSSDSVAKADEQTFSDLKSKHPEPSRPLHFPDGPDNSTRPLVVNSSSVLTSIDSFPTGSSGGIDGLSPQHLKDLVSLSAGEDGRKLLSSLTTLCNFLLAGKVNEVVCPLLYGASLFALTKKDGGVRPIAVGSVVRRLVAKLSCFSVKEEMAALFLPHQLGFGTKLGCEAAIHAARAYVSDPSHEDQVLLKIDFQNAFNSVERDVMLLRIREMAPSLYPFLSQCYRQSSNLFFDDKIILSQVGAQQGHPAGSLLFSLSIHHIVTALKSKLNLWYLDDGSICDKSDIVLADFQNIIVEAGKIGLKVNPSKCELYFCGEPNVESLLRFQTIAPGILVKSKSDLELLGSPIFDESVESFTSKKFEKIETMISRLQDVKAHFAYYLLKNCLTIPKLSYLIRTAPLWKFPCLIQNIDTKIKIVLENTLNVELNDQQWTQASLPVNHGGLGIRKLQDLSLPAFLASSFGVKCLVSTLINITDYETNLPNLKNALDCWKCLNPEKCPIILEKQKQWNEINIQRIVNTLVFPSEIDKFRFALLQNPFSGAWLNAVPSPNLGTLLDNDTIRTCIGLRLGSKLCRPHKCICGDNVDSSGHHGLSCNKMNGRYSRHYELNMIIKKSLQSINISSKLEPSGLSRNDGKRPDGATNVAWERGRTLVWDATCVDSLAKSNMNSTCTPGFASEQAAKKKHWRYVEVKTSHHFLAFAVETLGPWAEESIDFIKKIGKKLSKETGDTRSVSFLTQRVSLAIQRGNSTCITGTIPDGSRLEELFYL